MNKRMIKRTLSLILAGWMLAAAGCSQSGTNPEAAEDTIPTAVTPDTEATVEETAEVTDYYDQTGLPRDLNYDGYTFNALVFRNQTWGWCELCVDELNGEILNDAFYNRNLQVESMLNIKITQSTCGDGESQNVFRNSVQADEDAYSCGFMRQKHAATCAMNDTCVDLNLLGNMNLQNPWWDVHSLNDLTIGGKNYIVATDISIADKDAIWIIYFDKQILEENQFESPYTLVDEGRWTMDKMLEMMQKTARDMDGDGKMTTKDRWGLLTHSENFAASWMAAGERIASSAATGIPEIVCNTEQFANVWAKTIELMKDDSCYYNSISYISSGLAEGHTLFGTEVVAFLRAYRENERDFGVIPMPKYTEDQENYCTYVAEGTGLMVVPKTNSDFDRTGAILELLGATGKDQILDAYFEVGMKSRSARDVESGRMLDICFNTRTYDLGLMFDWGGISSTLRGGTENISSTMAKSAKATKKQMQKAFEVLGIE